MIPNHYEVLGVHPNASAADIKSAYRQLIRQYHSDTMISKKSQLEQKGVSPELIEELLGPRLQEATEKTQRLNEAYEVLSNPQKRQLYDVQYEEAFAPPKPPVLVAKPSSINLGTIRPNTRSNVEFTVHNTGGELLENINITNWDKVTWITDRQVEVNGDDVFPIKISFIVETTAKDSGTYSENIIVETAGSQLVIAVTFICEEVKKPTPSAVPGSASAWTSGSVAHGPATSSRPAGRKSKSVIDPVPLVFSWQSGNRLRIAIACLVFAATPFVSALLHVEVLVYLALFPVFMAIGAKQIVVKFHGMKEKQFMILFILLSLVSLVVVTFIVVTDQTQRLAVSTFHGQQIVFSDEMILSLFMLAGTSATTILSLFVFLNRIKTGKPGKAYFSHYLSMSLFIASMVVANIDLFGYFPLGENVLLLLWIGVITFFSA
ncbi:MAG: J domain-containing protein [bacterium]|nr:J domain-containing protein [bacterium]